MLQQPSLLDTDDRVRVPERVYAGLCAAQEAGAHPMTARYRIANWCFANGYLDAALWIINHATEYTAGVLNGWAAEQ